VINARIAIASGTVNVDDVITYVDPFDDKPLTGRRCNVPDKSIPQYDFWACSPRSDRIVLRTRLRNCNFGKPSSSDNLD
jgi:hypothetical protein